MDHRRHGGTEAELEAVLALVRTKEDLDRESKGKPFQEAISDQEERADPKRKPRKGKRGEGKGEEDK